MEVISCDIFAANKKMKSRNRLKEGGPDFFFFFFSSLAGFSTPFPAILAWMQLYV